MDISREKDGLFLQLNDSSYLRVDAVTSDQHFGHRNIARYTGRPFDNSESTEQMDRALVEAWNAVVAPHEVVLHLGDAALGDRHYSLGLVHDLNGVKILKVGNHDEISGVVTKARRERFYPMYTNVFDFILSDLVSTHLVAIKDSEMQHGQASHYPAFVEEFGQKKDAKDKFEKFRPQLAKGEFLLHGHTHSHDVLQEQDSYAYHVGVEAHELAPVRSSEVLDWVFSRR